MEAWGSQMDARLAEEFSLLRGAYPDAVLRDRWVLIPSYTLPEGWSPSAIAVAFHLKPPYPAASPYGVYAPIGMTFGDQPPANYTAAHPPPPFAGSWAVFSWQADSWRPGAHASDGHNMLTWAEGIRRRFREGC